MEVEAEEVNKMQFSSQATNYVYDSDGHAASTFTYDYNAGSCQPTSFGDGSQGCICETITLSCGEQSAADSRGFSHFTHVYQQFNAGSGSDTPPVYYYGHRYYMPEVGRWASRDPIQEICSPPGRDLKEDATQFLSYYWGALIRLARAEGPLDAQHLIKIKKGLNTLSHKIDLVISGDPSLVLLVSGGNQYGAFANNAGNLFDSLGLTDYKTCVGKARVVGGNPKTVGKQGGFPGTEVAAGSVAIIPSQWGRAMLS